MHSLSPAASSPDAADPHARPVLLVALSARALAVAARRAGYAPIALDLFGDCDTLRIAPGSERLAGDLAHGFRREALLDAVERRVRVLGDRLAGLAYGAGFEDRPVLLGALAERVAILGNGPSSVAAVKDPRRFFETLAALSIPHPETRFDAPEPGPGWLTKRIGGSGGGHVRSRRTRSDRGPAGRYFQRRVAGRAVGVSFLADGKAGRLLGCAEQWTAPAGGDSPFRYGGAMQPARLPERAAARIARAIGALVPAFGLRGLNSADFLVREDGIDLIEVNPRPGASLELFDRGATLPLFALHVAACAGRLGNAASLAVTSPGAAAVVYAETALRIPPGFCWPAWAADIPHPESVIEAGAPLCSVFADAATPEAARAAVLARGRDILRDLQTPRRPVASVAPGVMLEAGR